MKQEIIELFEAHGNLFVQGNRVWSPEQLIIAYKIYNLYHNTNKADVGCGSCRRETVNSVRGIYQEYLKIKQ